MFSVIFDMDGTLLDTQRICTPAWEYSGRCQGIVGMGEYLPYVCGMNREGWSKYILERHPNIDVEKFNKVTREYIIKYGKITYKKGAHELLEYLRGRKVRIALASGSSRASITHHINEVGAMHYFDAIVGGDDVERGKPAPDVFLRAAEQIGAIAEDCFVFEDSANGVRAAHNAGMKAFGIPDIVAFDSEVKKLLFMELEHLGQAIEIFEKM